MPIYNGNGLAATSARLSLDSSFRPACDWDRRGGQAGGRGLAFQGVCVLSQQVRAEVDQGNRTTSSELQGPWPRLQGEVVQKLTQEIAFLLLSFPVSVRDGEKNLQLKNVTFNLTLEPEHLQICLSR